MVALCQFGPEDCVSCLATSKWKYLANINSTMVKGKKKKNLILHCCQMENTSKISPSGTDSCIINIKPCFPVVKCTNKTP